MKTKLNKGFTLIELLVVITIIAILASLAVPTFGRIQERGNITKGINNCKQIILSQQLYASDNNGRYSDKDSEGNDADNANDAFRNLFIAEVLDNETIFGCPVSNWGIPDGRIGESPGFDQAVGRNENHWMMTAGLTNSSSGSIPAVFEAATQAEWDPEWNADAAGQADVQGRTWGGGKIIIGLNDSSVTLTDLAGRRGVQKLKGEADNLFARQPIEKDILGVDGEG
ncbi:type II secretion system protein [Phragmitibacter flavus]|uniref:Type II secretion system protein n=1 Tax=Phragmitibacter flavus TaxID=2576071 RepID=A0A5R8K9B5_9BACT|nr:type II secretion system protein [Phragmitibacter flavus]TLD68881.1 type II secretion system protein [Phragmitibacter flavus]